MNQTQLMSMDQSPEMIQEHRQQLLEEIFTLTMEALRNRLSGDTVTAADVKNAMSFCDDQGLKVPVAETVGIRSTLTSREDPEEE